MSRGRSVRSGACFDDELVPLEVGLVVVHACVATDVLLRDVRMVPLPCVGSFLVLVPLEVLDVLGHWSVLLRLIRHGDLPSVRSIRPGMD